MNLRLSKISFSPENIIPKTIFTVLSVFVIFGNDIPFTNSGADSSEIVTSNITNQIVYTALFIVSIIFLIPRFKTLLRFIRYEKFLSLIIFWAFLSLFWSDYFLVSFKRFFQFFSLTLVLFISYTYIDRKQIFNILKYLIFIYVPVNLLANLTIPQAIDPAFNTWRGMAPTKNLFGQVGIIILLFSVTIYKQEIKLNQKYMLLLIGFIAIIFIFMSFSSTSIIALLIISIFAFSFKLDQLFNSIKIKKFFTISAIILTISFFVLFSIFAPNVYSDFALLFGKDLSFTGRTDLWNDILAKTKDYFIYGCGYGGFWIIESTEIQLLYQTYLFLPNQAHNGYIDLYNELGLVGITLFVFFLINFLRRAVKLDDKVAVLVIIANLVANFSESTLFKVGWPLNYLFLIYYLDVTSGTMNKYRGIENV